MLSTLASMPALVKLIVIAIIFVISNGTLFTKRFKEHSFLKALVSLVAVTSTLLLAEQVLKMFSIEVNILLLLVAGIIIVIVLLATVYSDKFTKTKNETKVKADTLDFEPEMVPISKGSFTMGSYDGNPNEKPPHRVDINYDFEIGKYPVTIGQYKRFVEETVGNYPEWLEEGSDYNVYTGDNDWYKSICLEDDCPIIGVSWHDAKAYVTWLNQKTGKNYRLPSEAEWEYVARSGTKTKWSFGDDASYLNQYAWYGDNSKKTTHKVGTKKPNPWGVYDVHGNVWEWCEDYYVENYKNTSKDGKANFVKKSHVKVLRGGSWFNYDYNARSASRYRLNPTLRDYNVGFRLLRTLP